MGQDFDKIRLVTKGLEFEDMALEGIGSGQFKPALGIAHNGGDAEGRIGPAYNRARLGALLGIEDAAPKACLGIEGQATEAAYKEEEEGFHGLFFD